MKILFIDRSTRLTSVDDLETKPRGGMVQSLFRVSDYLASKGHEVVILSDIKTPGLSRASVSWRNKLSTFKEEFERWDVLICNRGIGDGYPNIRAKRRILWAHDLPHSGFAPNPQMLKAFHAVFMSRYAEKVWRTFYPTIGKSHQIPNGVDDWFYSRDKDYKKVVYFSHPNRGLKRLDFISDCLKTRVPGVEVEAYSDSGMYPTDKEVLGDYVDMDIPTTEGHVTLKKPLISRELAEVVGQAGLCILPTGYPEICSNSVLQSIKSGTPLITTGNLGATQEWVKHRKNGMLTEFLPNDYMVHSVEIVRHAVEVLTNRVFHMKLIKGCEKTKILNWEEVGEKWHKLLCSLI